MAETKPTTEGTIPFSVPNAGKACFTSYKIFGSLKEKGTTPLILVHGGPGLSYDYMLSCLPLYEKFGIPLVLYDQLGNGESTHLREKRGDETFWTEALFISELSNLVTKLELTEYDLLGHSWGGMMGANFAGLRPKGLRKLVLSNSPATAKSWAGAYQTYRKQLPEEVQDVLDKNEKEGTMESEEYQGAMMEFSKRYMCSVVPFPEEFARSFEWVGKDDTVSFTMNGPTEFDISGSLKNWSAVEGAKNVEVETLVINGTEEGATDEGIKPFIEGIKKVKWVKFKNSRHMPVYEEQDKYFDVVSGFLQGN